MKTIPVVRITPTKSFTLNNRWYDKVKPKGHLFFVGQDLEQVKAWVNFFLWKKHKHFLFIHIGTIQATNYSTRVLSTYKGIPLIEIMIREIDYHKSKMGRPKRVTKNTKYSYLKGLPKNKKRK